MLSDPNMMVRTKIEAHVTGGRVRVDFAPGRGFRGGVRGTIELPSVEFELDRSNEEMFDHVTGMLLLWSRFGTSLRVVARADHPVFYIGSLNNWVPVPMAALGEAVL